MKRIFSVCILTVIIGVSSANSQFFDSLVVKTRLFQWLPLLNPNIAVEKPVSAKFSVDFEYMYRNIAWYAHGDPASEHGLRWFYRCDGYQFLFGVKRYFFKAFNAPIGVYLGSQVAVNRVSFEDIKHHSSNGYDYWMDIDRNWTEWKFNIGFQFTDRHRATIEFYLSPSVYIHYESISTETRNSIPGVDSKSVDKHTYPFGEYKGFRPGFTVGYLF